MKAIHLGKLLVSLLLPLGIGAVAGMFTAKAIGLALLDIVALWIMIVLMLIRFYQLKPIAAYINIPYLMWVSFATVLNAAYFFLNR